MGELATEMPPSRVVRSQARCAMVRFASCSLLRHLRSLPCPHLRQVHVDMDLARSDAVRLKDEGVALFGRREVESAISKYNQAIAADPAFAAAYLHRGLAYVALLKLEQAIEDYNQAIKLDPQFVAAYLRRGAAYFQLQKLEQAIEDYNQAIKLDPRFVVAYNHRGTAYFQLQKLEQAIEDYNQAIKLDPQFVVAYNNRGNAYFQLQKLEQAIEDYNQAIKLDPKFAFPYNNRGLALLKQNQLAQAIEDCTQAIALKPNYPSAFFNRGLALVRLHKLSEAIEDLSQAITLKIDCPEDGFFNRGVAFLKLGKLDQAIADFCEASWLAPKSGRGLLGLGRARVRARDRPQALEALTLARDLLSREIAHHPNNSLLRLWRGQALRELALLEPLSSWRSSRRALFTQALSELDQALSIDPSLVEARIERGYTRLASGNTDQARQDFAVACDAVPQRTFLSRSLLISLPTLSYLLIRSWESQRYPALFKS